MSQRASAIVVSAVAVAGIGALVAITWRGTGGELVFPLDDAYIHLAVARTLAESGTWGVNPGEFASASSSPLWTAALALAFRLSVVSPAWALVGNVLATLGVVFAARGWAPDRPVASLLAMVLLAPIPFLAGLGMEHVLHLALALVLVRAVEARSAWVPVLAVLAVLTRYETLLLCAAMVVVMRSRSSLVALGAALLAVGAFGAWSAAQGGAWVPNGITKKANAGAWAGVVAAAKEDPWVLLLGVLALLPGTTRGRVVALTIALQAVFGRFGWFWRYEGWLLAMGILVVGPWVTVRRAWVLLLVVPLTLRAWDAAVAFPAGARFCALADVSVGRWLARAWPGVPVAVHDLGAAAFYGRSPIVDLAGLGTEEIARRRGTLDPASMASILQARGVALVVAGRDWPGGTRPPGAVAVAGLYVTYPREPGEFETVLWALHDPAEVAARLDDVWPDGVRLRRADGPEVDLGTATLTGAAVRLEEGGVTFYTNGRARMLAPATGHLRLTWHGTPAAGRGPIFTVEVDGVAFAADGIIPVRAGQSVELVYADDLVDADGADRNLYVRRVYVE